MLSLNQIKHILIGYFEAHGQINSVFYENDFNFNSERNIQYPTSNIEYLTSSISDRTVNHSFKFVIGDLYDCNNPDMVDEIYSDSLLIAEDFFTFLQNYEGIIFNKTVSIQKFSDDTHDRVSGIVFTCTISTIRSQNFCNSPKKN